MDTENTDATTGTAKSTAMDMVTAKNTLRHLYDFIKYEELIICYTYAMKSKPL